MLHVDVVQNFVMFVEQNGGLADAPRMTRKGYWKS